MALILPSRSPSVEAKPRRAGWGMVKAMPPERMVGNCIILQFTKWRIFVKMMISVKNSAILTKKFVKSLTGYGGIFNATFQCVPLSDFLRQFDGNFIKFLSFWWKNFVKSLTGWYFQCHFSIRTAQRFSHQFDGKIELALKMSFIF